MDTTTPEGSPLAAALAKLEEAMRPPRGSSSDPDRRRVASRLSDLARCEDDELSAFARRHLPGRTVDEAALRAAREMILTIGRLLGPEGEGAEALGALEDMRRALDARLSDARKAAAPPASVGPMSSPGSAAAMSSAASAAPMPSPVSASPMPSPVLAAPISGPASAPSPPSVAEPPSVPSPPSLTLKQYAGLVVTCELYPAYVERTNASYGIANAAARVALDAHWSARIAADPALAAQWRELCEAARKYFMQSR